jgi:hypothetical protein
MHQGWSQEGNRMVVTWLPFLFGEKKYTFETSIFNSPLWEPHFDSVKTKKKRQEEDIAVIVNL